MLTIVHAGTDYVHYRVGGKVTAADIERLFGAINPIYASHGKVNLLSEVPQFGGYEGVRTILKVLRNEPTLLWKAQKYALVTDDNVLRRAFHFGSCFVYRPAVMVYPTQELHQAVAWLTSN